MPFVRVRIPAASCEVLFLGKSGKTRRKLTPSEREGITASIKDTNVLADSSMRALTESFCQTAIEQFLIVARSVGETSVVPRQDRIAVLYSAIDEITKIIDSISTPTPLDEIVLWKDWNRKVKQKTRHHQPLDDLEQTRNPFLYAGRFYGDGCPLAVIGRRDPGLARALQGWGRRHGNNTGYAFPVERAENDRLAALIGANPDFNTLPASKLLRARALLTMKNFLAVRRSRAARPKRAMG